MPKRLIAPVLAVASVTVVASMIFTAAPALAASTAKAALNEVLAHAKKWQADAVLTHVSTLTAKADGTARSWLYTVYSPKLKKSAIATARNLEVDLEEVGRNTSVDPLAGDFMDSDKALDAARKAGLKASADGIGLGLTTFGQATGKPRVYWTVTVMDDTAISSVTLDPKDGTLIKRDNVKLK
ncbi:MAG: hypothetical protein IT518_16525 [Burkholderiales bacterium]|nr:hypothetical protein [Burkholderiales bacterium]